MCYFKYGSLVRDGALFCGNCGTLRRNTTHDPNGSSDFLIRYYFSKEMTYETVAHVLNTFHDIQLLLMKLYV